VTEFDTCMLCPRLCRAACPVATGSGREAAVPTQIAGVLRSWRRGEASADLARQAATLCVDCGACQDLCHLHRPLPELLREARQELCSSTAPEPVRPIEGEADWVAVEFDDRSWASALARRLRRPMARLRTRDGLGEAVLATGAHEGHFRAVAHRLRGLHVVVADGASARVVAHLGLPHSWLHDLLGQADGVCSCVASGSEAPMACCGARGPLPVHHPDDAQRMAAHWLRREPGRYHHDGRCAAHLSAAGGDVVDAVGMLLEAS